MTKVVGDLFAANAAGLLIWVPGRMKVIALRMLRRRILLSIRMGRNYISNRRLNNVVDLRIWEFDFGPFDAAEHRRDEGQQPNRSLSQNWERVG